jgi:hypothetical protein
MPSSDTSSSGYRLDGPVDAIYLPQVIAEFRGNPFIEALPPILDKLGAAQAMQNIIEVSEEQVALPAEIRLHMLGAIERFIQPLSAHIDLQSHISALLRWGYVDRNPVRPGFLRHLLSASVTSAAEAENARSYDNGRGKGSGLTLLGQSGVGKTTAIEAVLRTFPQVINHPRLNGALRSVKQLVWLVISCPPGGSMKELCNDFFRQVDHFLGTGYHLLFVKVGAPVDELRAAMGKVAFIHGLGVLVVDELQNLNEAKSGVDRQTMMNFFKLLRDGMKVPVITVGTLQATRLVGGNSQMARRHSDLPPFERTEAGPEFALFCSSLFEAQYLPKRVNVDRTDEDSVTMCGSGTAVQQGGAGGVDEVEPSASSWLELLHALSQGVAAVLVKLFIIAQHAAISAGDEQLTQGHFRAVYQTCFERMHPFLDRMRLGLPVDEVAFDMAVRESSVSTLVSRLKTLDPIKSSKNSSRLSSLLQTQAAEPPVSLAKGTGVKKRRSPRRKATVSPVKLVAVMETGLEHALDAHASLTKAGFVRDLGLEVDG